MDKKKVKETSLKKARLVQKSKGKILKTKRSESRLLLIFDAMERNGGTHRTIIGNKPTITDKVTSVKNGRGEKAIKDFYFPPSKSNVGKKRRKKKEKNYDYNFSDDITAKYNRLEEIAAEAGTSLYDVTLLLNDLANLILRTSDADTNSPSMIKKVYRWIYNSKLIKDAIIVLEECGNSDVEIWTDAELNVTLSDSQKLPRLHLHIITHLTEKEAQTLRDKFLCKQRSRIQVKDYWDSKQEFTHLHEIEEEQFGAVPLHKPDPNDEHWINQFKRERLGGKYLYTRLPVSLNYADYLTKQFHLGFTKDRTDTYIGLDGYQRVRERLFELSKGIDKRVLPKRSSRRRR